MGPTDSSHFFINIFIVLIINLGCFLDVAVSLLQTREAVEGHVDSFPMGHQGTCVLITPLSYYKGKLIQVME